MEDAKGLHVFSFELGSLNDSFFSGVELSLIVCIMKQVFMLQKGGVVFKRHGIQKICYSLLRACKKTRSSLSFFRLSKPQDNSAWERAHAYLAYGFTDAGQQAVANVGYVVSWPIPKNCHSKRQPYPKKHKNI